MWRTILGLSAVLLPFIGAPMGVKAEELKPAVPQSATSTVVNNLSQAPRRLSTREVVAELKAMGKQPGPPPVIPAIQADLAPMVVTTPQQEHVAPRTDLIRPDGAIPQQQAGEKWQPVRVHSEFRSRPRDTTFDVKAELVTKTGWMFGAQYVNQSGNFSGENLKETWKGQYTDTRLEFWAGGHWSSQDGRTRGSVNAFVRQLGHEDLGKGKSRPGTEYPYAYSWKNVPQPLTQLGVRARIERDLIQDKSQQLTVHLEGEAAATVSGQSGWAYDVQAGVWYRNAHVEAYGEVGVNNTGGYANGYGRYYLTKGGQLRPFAEVRAETGSGYSNLQVGGGLQVGLGQNAYLEGVLGYNSGTSGDGLTATVRAGFRF